jgi:NAD-dependent SIR2 family protein deacetylase
MEEQVLRATVALAHADAVLVLMGAGMGVDSQLPTFRGSTAMTWTRTDTGQVMTYDQVCRGDFYAPGASAADRAQADLFWAVCRQAYECATPHQGYRLLFDKDAGLLARKPFFVLTTNLDSHCRRSGVPPAQLYEIHGSTRDKQCCAPGPVCNSLQPWNAQTCAGCQGPVRPHVFMFADAGFQDELHATERVAYDAFVRTYRERALTVLVIGAGHEVNTIDAELAFLRRTCARLTTVRIDPMVDANSKEDVHIEAGALQALTAMRQNSMEGRE